MTEPNLGAHRAPSPASGTTVTLSEAALRANIASARENADVRSVDPLAADAWGHGREWVGTVLNASDVDDAAARVLSGSHLYGLPGTGGAPVMRVSGRVLSTKSLRAGEGVSYGYVHRAPEDTRIALVTGGYAQGVVRALGSRAIVSIDGIPCPIVGRVAMDVCVVDVGVHDVGRGAEAVFFGDPAAGEPSIEEWERATGLPAAELITAAGLRGRRRIA